MRGKVIIGPKGEQPSGMKCTRCKEPAEIRLPSHNAKFCDPCFEKFFRAGVERGLKMVGFSLETPLAMAVSGGKDSLACWDVLARLGAKVLGIHIDLGLGEFSSASIKAVKEFAAEKGLEFKIFELKEVFGYQIPEVARATRLQTCSVCGTLKRSVLNRLAMAEGCPALATGHHLDDETGRLVGNLIRHKTQYLDKFYPYLPSAHPHQAARIKPLFRLDQNEIRAYCRIRGIRPAEGEGCPFSKGATSHYFQEAMAFLEDRMPGTKRDFLFTYLKGRKPPLEETFQTCSSCGQPTYGELCGVCRLQEKISERTWA